jgi:hypothetical protein
MKSIKRTFVVATSLSVFLFPTLVSAGTCVTKSGWFVPYNCSDTGGKTSSGKKIMTCC